LVLEVLKSWSSPPTLVVVHDAAQGVDEESAWKYVLGGSALIPRGDDRFGLRTFDL
jgi:hypothetical protein